MSFLETELRKNFSDPICKKFPSKKKYDTIKGFNWPLNERRFSDLSNKWHPQLKKRKKDMFS